MRAMREQLQINSRADSCPGTGSSIPPTRHLCQHGWRCETPPPKRLPLGDSSGNPTSPTFHTFVVRSTKACWLGCL